jgi:Ti-type conjugative transfer relaxase TraA
LAIYHFSAKVIGRSGGRSAIASAAYRAGERLHDDKLDRDHDYTDKAGVVHRAVILPAGAPERWADRGTLWNEVEAGEKRRDAQLARDIEISLPRELGKAEAIRLAEDFVREQFVARGMVADLNVHWTQARDGGEQPHAHIMLTMREVVLGKGGPDGREAAGFGKKVVDWNDRDLLRSWRVRWATLANERLAALGLDVAIDHRSLQDQGIALEPQNKIGPAGARREDRGEQAERAAEHEAIARRNGERIIAEPDRVLAAITRQQSTFTRQDLARLVDRHTADAAQFVTAMAVVEASPELVRVGIDGRGRERFSTREMLGVEERLEVASYDLVGRAGHRVSKGVQERALANAERALKGEQLAAFEHVTKGADIAAVVGYAGTGKSTMLGVARAAWEASGYRVQGAALSGIAAEGLEGGAGIQSRTLASLEHGWAQGRDLLSARDVLVVDEAGMVGSRQMERVLAAARNAGAKVVLVGDPEQLQAIEAGAAFRAVAERVGAVEITEVHRQREGWQQQATRELATERTAAALARYEAAGMLHEHATLDEAQAGLVAEWNAVRQESPAASQIMLAHRRVDVRALNEQARALRQEAGELGTDHRLPTGRGERAFAEGDRLYFLKNERSLGVKNGTLGTVEQIRGEGLNASFMVRLDGVNGAGTGRTVSFDLKDYNEIDHGYAATVHKSQGVTVDRAHVLATQGMDRHAAYVGLSRHRDGVSLHWSRDEMGSQDGLETRLGRERLKDTSLDYAWDGQTDQDREIQSESQAPVGTYPYAERRGLVPEREIVVREHQVRPAQVRPAQVRPAEVQRDMGDSLRTKVRAAQARAAEARREGAQAEASAERPEHKRHVSPPGVSMPGLFDESKLGTNRRVQAEPHHDAVSGLTTPPAQERGPARAPAGDAAPEQAIASGRASAGRAGFRDRYEAHKRQQAVEAARDEQARDLVRQWEHLTEAYNKALPGLEADPTLGGTWAGLLRFGDALQAHPDAAQALRERGPTFGIADDSPLARVLADRQPSRAIAGLMNGVEETMRDHLKHQAAERLERSLSRGHGMSR